MPQVEIMQEQTAKIPFRNVSLIINIGKSFFHDVMQSVHVFQVTFSIHDYFLGIFGEKCSLFV